MNGLLLWNVNEQGKQRPEALGSHSGNQLIGFREAILANSLAPVSATKVLRTGDFLERTSGPVTTHQEALTWRGPILAVDRGQLRSVVPISFSRSTTTGAFLPVAAKAAVLQPVLIDTCRNLVPEVQAVRAEFTTDPDEGTPKLVLTITTTASVAEVLDAEDRLAGRVTEISSAVPEVEVVFTYRFGTS